MATYLAKRRSSASRLRRSPRLVGNSGSEGCPRRSSSHVRSEAVVPAVSGVTRSLRPLPWQLMCAPVPRCMSPQSRSVSSEARSPVWTANGRRHNAEVGVIRAPLRTRRRPRPVTTSAGPSTWTHGSPSISRAPARRSCAPRSPPACRSSWPSPSPARVSSNAGSSAGTRPVSSVPAAVPPAAAKPADPGGQRALGRAPDRGARRPWQPQCPSGARSNSGKGNTCSYHSAMVPEPWVIPPESDRPARRCCRCGRSFAPEDLSAAGPGWSPLRDGWRCPGCTRAYEARIDRSPAGWSPTTSSGAGCTPTSTPPRPSACSATSSAARRRCCSSALDDSRLGLAAPAPTTPSGRRSASRPARSRGSDDP
jgi:hypothetical protein